MTLTIDSELRSLIPPLSESERATLEESILRDGIRDALAVWQGVIVDGHNRYDIAEKYGLDYRSVEMGFRDREEAMIWMIDNQRGRRNLTKQAWLDLGFKRAELLKPRAEANRAEFHGNQYTGAVFQESEKVQPINTVKEAAEYAGVSVDTAAKYKRVMSDAPDEIKQKVRTGETSINRAYQEIKQPVKEPEKEDDGPDIDDDFSEDVDAEPTEDQQKKEQGEKYALSIIQFAEKLLHATDSRTKGSAISALDQWISKQRETL